MDVTVPLAQVEPVRKQLLDTLRSAMRERSDRQDLVDGEPGWVRHERAVMYAAVNRLRSGAGLPPVHAVEFERAEQRAVGHVDYAQKWSLYCAWLACGLSSTGPS